MQLGERLQTYQPSIAKEVIIMPNKYAEKKGWKVPKQKYKIKNWSEYNEATITNHLK